MSRELAGIIACIQEIEIALSELEAAEDLSGRENLAGLQSQVLRFLSGPSASAAREIEEALAEIENGPAGDSSSRNLMKTEVAVDNIRTSLSRLHIELREVLEDLE